MRVLALLVSLVLFVAVSSGAAQAQGAPTGPMPAPASPPQGEPTGPMSAPAAPGMRVNDASGSPARLAALREVRLASRAEKRREGLWLFGWGVANALGGSVAAAARHGDEAWVAAGVTTASFGAINALLALGLLDLSGARRRAILADHYGAHTGFADVREAELVGQLQSGQGFALNAGLDVFYIAAGLMLYAIGRVRSDASGWEEGAGLAMAGQGGFLLGFDVVAWARSNRRAAATRGLR